MRLVQALLFSSLALLLSETTFSAPSITGVSGTASDGSAITITGSAFGTKATAAPGLWDRVDNISSYSGVADGAAVPTGGSNPWDDNTALNPGAVKMERTDAHRAFGGTAQYKAISNNAALEGRTLSSGNLYVSWWFKPQSSFTGGDHSSKLIRVGASSDYINNTFSWTQQQSYVYSSSAGYCANDWHDWGGNANAWNFVELWFNNSAKTYTIRVNGANVVNASSWSGCSFNFNYIWMLGFDGGGNSPPTLTWWLDDVYADNTFARVMLGNAATYSASTVFEMQPATSWSASSISVTFNRGSFGSGQTAYLYVVDSTGAVNASGYPITVGAGGGTTYTVTPSAGSNGSISPSTPQTVSSGGTVGFTVTPNSGYMASVGGTCGGSPSTGTGTFTYTTSTISANCTVAATFAATPITYTVTGTAGAGGSISPASQTVNSGSTATLTVTTNAGYTASASGCGGSLSGTTYTTGAIASNCSVSATFCKKLSVPASLVATGLTPNPPSNATISFDWADVNSHTDSSALSGDLANYRLHWGTTSGGPYNTASSATSSISVGPTQANITYYARVGAESSLNAVCNSDLSSEISFYADTVPPVLSGLSPSGSLSKYTTSVTLSATTSESATCRYGYKGVSWSSRTPFSTTGSTSHSSSIPVWAGLVKRVCTLCRDALGNESSDGCTSFSVNAKPKRWQVN